jgi:hypothetical protein
MGPQSDSAHMILDASGKNMATSNDDLKGQSKVGSTWGNTYFNKPTWNLKQGWKPWKKPH